MIDDIDASGSTLRLLVSQALKSWSIDAVLGLLVDDDYIVRTTAARELHIRGDKTIFEEVSKLNSDTRPYVREICAFVLGQLGTPSMPFRDKSYSIVLDLLRDKDSEVRMAAAAALGHMSYDTMPAAVENTLIEQSADNDKEVRACVAYALGNSSGSDIVKRALMRLETDMEERVRSYAKLGMELIADKQKQIDGVKFD